jgi:hypothetical protein
MEEATVKRGFFCLNRFEDSRIRGFKNSNVFSYEIQNSII